MAHESERNSGTSYAVAHLAGVAALWLGRHGMRAVCDRYESKRVQGAFLHLLRTVGTRRPADWDDDWGVGVVDAHALGSAPLPAADEVGDGVGAFGATDEPVDRLSALLGDTDPDTLRTALSARLDVPATELEPVLRRFEGELAYLLVDDDDFRESVVAAGQPGAFPPRPVRVPAAASPDLRVRLR
jgi:hypothetical protein